MYEFAWPSPVFGGRLGAFHGLEIPFVFDTLSKGGQLIGAPLGDRPPQELAGAMHGAWMRSPPTATRAGPLRPRATGPPCASTPPHR